MKNIFIFTIIFTSFTLLSCNQPEDENPQWIQDLIVQFQNEPVGNPPQSIWQYFYNGRTVYYIPAQCCDQPSTLYDANGNILCAPDGGYSGKGDGKCPDFFTNRRDEKLIWQDKRTR